MQHKHIEYRMEYEYGAESDHPQKGETRRGEARRGEGKLVQLTMYEVCLHFTLRYNIYIITTTAIYDNIYIIIL
jgi:hypothetical protein